MSKNVSKETLPHFSKSYFKMSVHSTSNVKHQSSVTLGRVCRRLLKVMAFLDLQALLHIPVLSLDMCLDIA